MSPELLNLLKQYNVYKTFIVNEHIGTVSYEGLKEKGVLLSFDDFCDQRGYKRSAQRKEQHKIVYATGLKDRLKMMTVGELILLLRLYAAEQAQLELLVEAEMQEAAGFGMF